MTGMSIVPLAFRGAGLLGCLICLVFSAPAPAAAGGVYFVKPGDTLTGISQLFGVPADRIRKTNRLGAGDVRPGDRVRIPDIVSKSDPLPEVSRQRDVIVVPVPPVLTPKPEPLVVLSQRHEVSSDRVLQALCRDETVYHAIVKGDTLYSLSIRYATELNSLLKLNGLRKNARLSIGQKILVRKSGPRTHTVGRGETLFRIASRYGVETDVIVRLNQLKGTKLSAGQQLLIEPCDPYMTAGSAPPPLGGRDFAGPEAGGSIATTTDAAATISQRLITLARTMLNVPYRFGGSTLRGIDCSAYVQRVFRLLDVQIPRTAREQYTIGARISPGDIQIGDLVFFRTYASFPSHVGIYIGENLFIHASSMVHRVTIDSMDRPYYRKRFIGARRLLDDGGPAVASTP